MGAKKHAVLSPQSLRNAFRAWNRVETLGGHPLAGLSIVEARRQIAGYSDAPAGRGLALRETLRATLEAIRPETETPGLAEKRRRPYLVLTLQYLHGQPPGSVAAGLNISERAYYKEQVRALQMIADILSRWEELSSSGQTSIAGRPEARWSYPEVHERPVPFLAPPYPAHALVGRDSLLSELKRRLLENGNVLMALQGLPGVGKTTLAIALAHDPDIRGRFDDGTLWAGLGRQPDVLAVLGAWAAALHVPTEEIARCAKPMERAWRVHAAIGLRRMLLVIDDAWQAEAALALKVGGPNCAHLVTTRLAHVAVDFAGEANTSVCELDTAEGINLLAQLAPQVVSAEPQVTEALVRAVGGLPLALILMGRHLRTAGRHAQARRMREALAQLQAAQARLQLAQPQSLLEQPSDLPSQASLSLQASIGLSDAELDEAARQALRNLALFPPKPNTFTEAAALAVIDAPARVLDMLADHGLLESVGLGRYTIHQTIVDYARLEGADLETARRFVSYFVQYTVEHIADNELLDMERNNLLGALELAFNHQMYEKLVHGVNALHPFLMGRGLYAVAELHLSRALNLMPKTNDTERYALLLAREKAYDVLGKREAQNQDLVALEKLAEVMDNRSPSAEGQRRVQIALRRVHYAVMISDYSMAIATAQRAIGLAQAVHDLNSEAAGNMQWGYALARHEKYQAARERLEQAITLSRLTRARQIEAESLQHLSSVFKFQLCLTEATTYVRQALSIYRELGDRLGESYALNRLGSICVDLNNYAEAKIYFERALCITREIGDRSCEGRTLANLGGVFQDQGYYICAQIYLGKALCIFHEIDDRSFECTALDCLGAIDRDQGNYARAQAYLEQSLQISREIGGQHRECGTLIDLSLLFHRIGDNEVAKEYAQQGLQIAIDMGVRKDQGYGYTNLGHALAGLAQWAEAITAYHRAIAIWRELGQHSLAMGALAGLSSTLLAQGDLALAQAHVEEILSYLEGNTLSAFAEPARVYLTCYQVLKANADPRAQSILTTAYNLLHASAAQIDDEAMQRSFLENVPAHRELMATWERTIEL